MARKKSPTLLVQKKAARPMDQRPVVKPSSNAHTNAHPRLIHGFLIRLPAESDAAASHARHSLDDRASVNAPAQRRTDVKHEGPADDATFH